LPEKTENFLCSLNRLEEKAICSNFQLDMTNDMIALASNWKERHGPQNATRKMTNRFGLHKDEMALSRHYSVFHGIENKPPIHE